jgi:hypothetical protein
MSGSYAAGRSRSTGRRWSPATKRTASTPRVIARGRRRGRPRWTSAGVRNPSDVCGLSVLYQGSGSALATRFDCAIAPQLALRRKLRGRPPRRGTLRGCTVLLMTRCRGEPLLSMEMTCRSLSRGGIGWSRCCCRPFAATTRSIPPVAMRSRIGYEKRWQGSRVLRGCVECRPAPRVLWPACRGDHGRMNCAGVVYSSHGPAPLS